MEGIKISSCFGHEFMAMLFARVYNQNVLIIPNSDDKFDYYAEAAKIHMFMAPFYDWIQVVPFERRHEAGARDIIGELKEGKLPTEVWNDFFSQSLYPHPKGEKLLYHLGNNPVLMVPQKLISDEKCGVTAVQQSLSPAVFSFLKDKDVNLVLGQHFHKVKDLVEVKKLAAEFDMYVPGMSENPEVLGIRGVLHQHYLTMYAKLRASIGIAGTHTWIMLTCFPNIPQIILYNIHGVEPWGEIAAAARRNGRKVFALGFSETSNMDIIAEHLAAMYQYLKH